MSNEWLKRSLSSLEDETRDWPNWKLQAGSAEPHFAIPNPDRDSGARGEDARDELRSED